MTREAIEALFARRREANNRQDAAALAADYAPDCVVESPSAGVHHGRTTVEQVMRALFDALDIKVHEESVLIDGEDRKSTRLNSSHVAISYAVFCLKKKKC